MKETSSLTGSGAMYAEALLRSALGLLFVMTSIAKFRQIADTGYAAFVSTMATPFASTFLPGQLTSGFFYILPVLEALLGILLLTGYRRTWSLVGAGLLMIILLFGHLTAGMPFESLFLLLLTVAATLVLPAHSFWRKIA